MLDVTTLPASAGQSLRDLAERIRAEHLAGVVALVEHGMNAGDLLIKAKAKVGHGQFGDWVEANCKMSYSTARVYMQLARNRAVIESKMTEHCQFESLSIAGALKLISGPSKSNAHAAAASSAMAPPAAPAPGKAVTGSELAAQWRRMPDAQSLGRLRQVGVEAVGDNAGRLPRRR